MHVIASGDSEGVSRSLQEQPELALAQMQKGASRGGEPDFFLAEIEHHVYAGHSALHVAAAAYALDAARALLAAGASISVENRRGAQPLHYAADGNPMSPRWDPVAQHEIVAFLLASGADPDATDKNGTTPLLRAVRNLSASAVEALLEGGADPNAVNKSGSTAVELADGTTGRGGSGFAEAKAQQREILRLLRAAGAR